MPAVNAVGGPVLALTRTCLVSALACGIGRRARAGGRKEGGVSARGGWG